MKHPTPTPLRGPQWSLQRLTTILLRQFRTLPELSRITAIVILFLNCAMASTLSAATTGYTGGRKSSGTMFASCDLNGSYGVADRDWKLARWNDRQSRCFNDNKTCRVRCFVYCYPSASEVGWARELPCGEFTCTVFVPCLHHNDIVSAVGICDVPAAMPCSADFASLSCGKAVTSNCRERFIDQCPSTDLSEVCCE